MNTLYTTNGCPKCELAKMLLKEMKYPFEVSTDTDKALSLGIKSAPTLVLDDGTQKLMKDIMDMHKAFRKERNGK